MTALAIAAATALAAQCGQGVAPDTIVSIAKAESGLDTFAIHDNTTRRSFEPTTVQDAVALATDLIAVQHHRVDLGLMQVTSANLGWLGLSIADAFDACRSIEAGARILSGAYRRALRSALSDYNTGDPQKGISNGYVGIVEQVASSVPSIAQSAAPVAAPPEPPAPVASPPRNPWDVFAASGGTQFVFTNR
jgi:type IV secretion system protein VirB1